MYTPKNIFYIFRALICRGHSFIWAPETRNVQAIKQKSYDICNFPEIWPLGTLWIFLISIEMKASKGRGRPTHRYYYIVTCRSKAGRLKSEETFIARQPLGNTFPQRQNVTTPLLRQQVLGRHPLSARRKHIPVEKVSIREWTVFSVGPPRGYITKETEGVSRVGSRR
jgi:hypothetical protein